MLYWLPQISDFFYSLEDLAWLDQVLGTSRALTIMLLMMTTILSKRVYITPAQLEARGLGKAQQWREKAASVPGAFPTGGDWLFPLSGLRAIGMQVRNYPEGEIVDPDEQGGRNSNCRRIAISIADTIPP